MIISVEYSLSVFNHLIDPNHHNDLDDYGRSVIIDTPLHLISIVAGS
jgi:hypothetical protein